jgi:hypothetical protein
MSEIELRLEKANERGVLIAGKVLIFYGEGWHRLVSIEAMEKIRNKKELGITGKYLLFSTDLPELLEIGGREILEHDFHLAKVNSRLLGDNTEYVLCLYYKDDSRKHELAKRCKTDYPNVKYRYWKSDEATRKGEYSEEFLSKLDSRTRKQFTEGNAT